MIMVVLYESISELCKLGVESFDLRKAYSLASDGFLGHFALVVGS